VGFRAADCVVSASEVSGQDKGVGCGHFYTCTTRRVCQQSKGLVIM